MVKRRKMTNTAPSVDLSDVNEQELAKDTSAGEDTKLKWIQEKEQKRESSGDTAEKIPLESSTTSDNDVSVIVSPVAEERSLPTTSDDVKEVTVPVEPQKGGKDTEPPRTGGGEDRDNDSAEEEEPRVRKKRHKSGAPYVAVILTCLVLSVSLVVGAAFSRRRQEQEVAIDTRETTESTEGETEKVVTGDKLGAEEIYARGVRSSVSVAVTADGETEYYSGFAVFGDGYVATLCEAVESASSVEIVTCDGSVFPASVVGADRTVNLALLRTDAKELEGVSVGVSASLSEGNSVFAIGSVGGGRYASSLLATQVAYRERQPLMECYDGVQRRVTAIQLGALSDTSLKGCPIFDTYGKAVGIMLAAATDGEASLAIPLDRAMSVLEVMRKGETPSEEVLCSLAYTPPRLGISGEQAQVGEVWGVRVVDFADAASDAAAKLRIGDLIWRVNDTVVTDTSTLREQTERYRAGESVEVYVYRDGQTLSFFVSLV